MTSVERVLAYCNLPQERTEGERQGKGVVAVAKGWPASAALRFENVQVCCLAQRAAAACCAVLCYSSSRSRTPASSVSEPRQHQCDFCTQRWCDVYTQHWYDSSAPSS